MASETEHLKKECMFAGNYCYR